jgi:hypothetical protein
MNKYACITLLVLGLVSSQVSAALIGHYGLENNGTNSAVSAFDPIATLEGNAAYTTDARVGSYAVDLDGYEDYVSLGDNFNMNLSDWTVTAWIKTTEDAFARIVAKESVVGYSLYVSTGNKVGFTCGGLSESFVVPSGKTVYDGSFHLIAATYDRDGNATVYFDGDVLGSTDISSKVATDLNTTSPLYFGWRTTRGTGDFNGIIDDVRIYDEVLSLEDIQELGKSSAHYTFDNNAINSSVDGPSPVGIFGGDAEYTSDAKIGTHAVIFDGTADYVNLGDNFDLGTCDLTLAAWIKTDEKKFARIISKEGTGGYNLSLNFTDGVGCTINDTYHYYSATYEDGHFHHLAATYDRDGFATVFFDGEALGSFDISGEAGNLNNAVNLYLGWRAGSTPGSGDFNGIIDDVHIYQWALTPEEIKALIPPPGGTLIILQ